MKMIRGCLVVVGLLVVGFIVLAVGSENIREREATQGPQSDDVTGAWLMAEKFVEARLKSPGTAEFGSVFGGDYQDPEAQVRPLGDARYRVRGWVDSQNSFGATVRSQWVLTVRHTGGTNWQLEEFEFLE